MLTRILIAVLSLGMLAGQSASPPENKSPQNTATPEVRAAWMKALGNYGGWWNSLSDDSKDTYIDGYTTAMGRAHLFADGFGKGAEKDLKPGDPHFYTKLNEVVALRGLAAQFDFDIPSGSLKTHLADFYKEPLNQRIPLTDAFEYCRDEITARKSPGELLDELNSWRKIVNRN